MKHHKYNHSFNFFRDPVDFTKHSDKELLQYCLGATLYMPAIRKVAPIILTEKFLGLTSLVLCFEDAIADGQLLEAENNVVSQLEELVDAKKEDRISNNNIPLIFLRVRNLEQFIRFSKTLTSEHLQFITGFVFPKFSTSNGYHYLEHLDQINRDTQNVLYGLPILETREIAHKETRIHELTGIKNLLIPYKELILNIRVGTTDFSSLFGVRRGINYTIYDILPVRDCLSDILNFLNRDGEEYVLSAPVWEYFLADKDMKFAATLESSIHSNLLKRHLIVNEAIDGLLREVILDKANGFVGKTTIHPSHIKYVNAMQAVTKEEYEDAVQILGTDGGVVKSLQNNKMNEINPHRSWAKKVYYRAQAYGVIESEADYVKLFS